MVAVRAYSKQVGVSQKRVLPILQLVRNKRVNEAIDILELSNSPWAKVVAKTVKSAAANAENNQFADKEQLRIVKISADVAPTLRRFKPHARGRVGRMHRRSCHITVVVDEEEN
ncbi:50S ribosomal protein L22 [SAR202 cluster bacterium AD-804-J14_MRT_500m]|nr:50S ribosomal protein L22 [SAR202 cluster bacterium AD-804-J14_MRT_500m]